MDTGSEVSLVDGKVIAAATTEKCRSRITAANSQLIPVQGVIRNSEVEFDGRKVGWT